MRKKSLALSLMLMFLCIFGGNLMGQTSLPYEENFENLTNNTTPTNWTAINGNAKVYNSSIYSNFSNKCLNITGNGTTDSRVVVLPEFENQISTLQISCCHKSGSTNYGTFDIGYITNLEDVTSFVSLVNYPSTGIYSEVEISMATAPANAFIAFRHNPTSQYNSWYIDDLVVETIPTNHKPKNISCSWFSNSRATLGWTNGGSETVWQVAYSTTATFNPDEVTHVDVNTNPATITGLLGNTTYYACVRANLGNDTYSRWSYKCSFTTKCDPEDSFPFKEIFDYVNSSTEVPGCWDNSQGNINGTNKWKIYNDNGPDGTKGYIRMSVSGTTGTYNNYLISQMMNIPNENMKLSFYFKKTNQLKGRLDVYISVDGVIENTPIASDISVASTDWELKEIELPSEYKNTHNVAIVFKGTSAANSSYICLDDVKMEIVYSCVKPTGLAVSSITSSSATLSWIDGGQDSWDVYYSTSSIEPDQETLPTASNIETNSYSLSLEPHTAYYAWVRAKCGDNDYSSWSDGISFATSTTLPYSYDFTEPSDMGAWTMNNCYPSLTGRTGSDPDYYFHFNQNSGYNPQYLITPLFENSSNALLVSFDYKLSSGSATTILNVGYSTTNKEIGSFTFPSSATVEVNSTSYQKLEYIFQFEGIKYIAVKFDRNGNYLNTDIDNISFTPIDKVYTGGSEEWNYLADWTPAGLPESTDDVYINNAITIPNACAAEANNITLGPSGSLTIADGGQLVCNNAIQATVHKSITGYGEGNDKWYFIASPINVNDLAPTSVSNMLSNEYDLYQLNNTTWENYKEQEGNANPNFNLANGRGYLYANSTDVDLGFAGTTKPYDADYEISVAEGWNLVGNPYTFDAYVNTPYYAMNEGGTGITATTVSTSTAVKLCTGVIIKADDAGTVKFLNEAPASSTNNGNLQIALAHNVVSRDGASTKSATIDNAIVSFNEGTKLEKFYFGEQAANIFIPQNGDEYAIAFSDRKGEVPVNFKAKETGTYTINFDGTDLNNIKLIDKLENLVIDLNENSSYTFIGSPADRAERFVIRFENSEQSDNSVFAYQSGSDIVVTGEGELQIFDVMGRIVAKQYVSGVETINVKANGVYIFRLNEMTQKIVVK